MSAKQFGNPLAAGIEEIRSSWGWYLTLGILFMLLGAVCVIGDVSWPRAKLMTTNKTSSLGR